MACQARRAATTSQDIANRQGAVRWGVVAVAGRWLATPRSAWRVIDTPRRRSGRSPSADTSVGGHASPGAAPNSRERHGNVRRDPTRVLPGLHRAALEAGIYPLASAGQSAFPLLQDTADNRP